jgi:hypothetical protein
MVASEAEKMFLVDTIGGGKACQTALIPEKMRFPILTAFLAFSILCDS